MSTTGAVSTLSIIDYAVFAFMLIVSALIGLYYWWTGRGKSSANEFLMANRSMSVLPVSMSVMASFISAIALIGIPAEVYIYGLQNWAMICSFPVVMYVSAYMFMPVFYELQITSTYEVSYQVHFYNLAIVL